MWCLRPGESATIQLVGVFAGEEPDVVWLVGSWRGPDGARKVAMARARASVLPVNAVGVGGGS